MRLLQGLQIVSVAALMFLCSCSHPPPSYISVRILEGYSPTDIRISSSGEEFAATGSASPRVYTIQYLSGRLRYSNDDGIWKETASLSLGSSSDILSIEAGALKRKYQGELHISPDRPNGILRIINSLPLETYVDSVAWAESDPAETIPSAIKALAIVCRSFAFKGSRHSNYDFCDMAHCQIYRGVPAIPKSIKSALAESRGVRLDLAPGQRPAFHACCGGSLSHPLSAWGDKADEPAPRQYDEMRGKRLCASSPNYLWRRSASQENILAILREIEGSEIERISSWTISRKDASGRGRIFRFLVSFGSSVREIEVDARRFASTYGQTFDWRLFRSLLIDRITREGANFSLEGRGFGHGVGLCMAGSQTLASWGWHEEDILKFYFPGARLIPASDEIDRVRSD